MGAWNIPEDDDPDVDTKDSRRSSHSKSPPSGVNTGVGGFSILVTATVGRVAGAGALDGGASIDVCWLGGVCARGGWGNWGVGCSRVEGVTGGGVDCAAGSGVVG